jgi:hypothetical protein
MADTSSLPNFEILRERLARELILCLSLDHLTLWTA